MPRKELIDESTAEPCTNLALDTMKKEKQALIFVNTKRSAEKVAEDISKSIKTEDSELTKLSEKILKILSRPTKQCERLAKCIKKGIAFHHAGLTHKQKEIIEDSFRNRKIKIISCTPTLALGVDIPAFRTIIRDVKRYGGTYGLTYIPVLEFLQMAGRSGRPKYDSYGEAIAISSTKPEKKKIYDKYVLGEPEEIFSKLAVEPVLRTYLLSLISTRYVQTKNQIIDFFEKTFWAYQFKDMDKLTFIIEKMLDLLEEWEFIQSSQKEDFVSGDELLKDIKYKPTILGKRVAELYIDPLTAYNLISSVRMASSRRTRTFSFLQTVCHSLEMRPLLKVKAKEFDLMQEKLAEYEHYLLELEPSLYEPEYEDFINSFKTALMLQEWIDEKDEEFLMEKYNVRPGELRAKLNRADWLLYATAELTRILHFQKILKDINKARVRVKYGVKEEILPLLKLKDIGRVRARKLFRNSIKDLGDVRKASLTTLSQILGPKIANSIKDQMGDIDKQVPKGKRTGQISLGKY